MKRIQILAGLLAAALLLTCTSCGKTAVSSGGASDASGGSPSSDAQAPVIYEQEGVHNCVLMYPASGRDVEKTKPYVARMRDYMPTGEWLFDTFIYLQLLNTSGVFDDHVGATKEDWLSCLDRFFRSDTDIHALETSVRHLKQSIGDPPSKRKVVIGIPYPHKATENFGDVDGDGKEEDFLDPADRRKVLDWYIQEAIRRFDACEFEYIELWGFYWIEEAMATDEEAAAMASELIHDAGYKFMWIPYYEAPGYEKADEYFDVTIMQPNYAFNAWTVDGEVGPERMADTWDICRENGFGIEVEFRSNSPHDVAVFQRYLSYGAADRLGYQQHVNGYYLGAWFVENTYFSSNKEDVAIYELLCDYVTGKKVEDPDVYTESAVLTGQTLELESGTADRISQVQLLADTEKLGSWRGTITAEFYRDGAWQPAGWMSVAPDPLAEGTRTLAIPTEGPAEKIRLTVEGEAALPEGAVWATAVDHTGCRTQVNYCQGKSYTLTPDPASRTYGDTTGDLLSNGDDTNDRVGWYSRPARILVDLGEERTVDGLQLFVSESAGAGISLPASALAAFSGDTPLKQAESGLGALPGNFRLASGGTPQSTGKSGPGGAVYRIDFSVNSAGTRYITLEVEPQAARWMMFSELRVTSGGSTVPVASYTLLTLPQATLGTVKNDNGTQLTNGAVDYGLDNDCVAWDTETSPGTRDLVVDLEKSETIREITLYSVSSVAYGNAYSVRNAVFYTSEDGVNWTEQGIVDKSALIQGGNERIYPVPLTCKLAQPASARYLKVTITPGQGVCAISEITAS